MLRRDGSRPDPLRDVPRGTPSAPRRCSVPDGAQYSSTRPGAPYPTALKRFQPRRHRVLRLHSLGSHMEVSVPGLALPTRPNPAPKGHSPLLPCPEQAGGHVAERCAAPARCSSPCPPQQRHGPGPTVHQSLPIPLSDPMQGTPQPRGRPMEPGSSPLLVLSTPSTRHGGGLGSLEPRLRPRGSARGSLLMCCWLESWFLAPNRSPGPKEPQRSPKRAPEQGRSSRCLLEANVGRAGSLRASPSPAGSSPSCFCGPAWGQPWARGRRWAKLSPPSPPGTPPPRPPGYRPWPRRGLRHVGGR